MLFTFLKKQKLKRQKVDILKAAIGVMNVNEDIKTLYIESLSILEVNDLDKLYTTITMFIEKDELKEIEDFKKDSFVNIVGAKKKEVEEKKKEINAFSFLINNI